MATRKSIAQQVFSGEIGHFITRFNNREYLKTPATAALTKDLLKSILPRYGAKLYSLVMMDNHNHHISDGPTRNPDTVLGKFLEQLGRLVATGDMLRHLGSQLALGMNAFLGSDYQGKIVGDKALGALRQRFGSVIEGRTKTWALRAELRGLACLVYTFNPVRAGIVATPEEYPWSNYQMYSAGVLEEGFAFHPDYLGLGTTQEQRAKAFRELVAYLHAMWLDSLSPEQLKQWKSLIKRRGQQRRSHDIPLFIACTSRTRFPEVFHCYIQWATAWALLGRRPPPALAST